MLGEFGDNSCSLLISPAQLTRTLIRVLLMESAGRYSGREEWYIENIIWLFPYHIPYQPRSSRDDIDRGLIRDVIRKEPYHIMFIIYLNMRKSCSVLWIFSHVINIILRVMIKGWWYRYQSRQTNTVVMFFQYYICKFLYLVLSIW